ncbi:MAG TPA: hypothetical protein VEV81_12150, partial [Pyrinomonadaceae bacterium]|nr:hypothetical protein [Pyrinomonadaceae bacterium]
MTDSDERRAATLTAWTNFITEQGVANSPTPELEPVTATIRSLPPASSTSLHLPKVGDSATMNEEETRESLRRFITSITPLIGAEPQQLSLVQRTDLADGTRQARYEQRPFRYPLRGDYGVLEITFAPDRRVLQVTSTCIPEVEQLQRAGAGIRPKLTAEQVASQIAGKTFTYTDGAGHQQTFTVGGGEEIAVRELVIYPVPRASDPAVLEFHLAWEIAVGSGANQTIIYLDAVKDKPEEVIAVKQNSR